MEKTSNHFNKSLVWTLACVIFLATNEVDTARCAAKFQQFAGHTACLDKSTKAKPIVLSQQEKDNLLNMHNKLRGNVTPPATNMLKMSWDDEVAMVAQRWADNCVKGTHDKIRFIPGRFSLGQNLAWGLPVLDVPAAVRGWYEEYKDYKFGEEMKWFPSGPKIGHYTQMAWAMTNKLGCAFTNCTDFQLLACNYGPRGNEFPFSSPYENGTRCSKCETCVDGLCECSPGLECDNYGVLQVDTCKCTCSAQPYYTGPRCQLNCSGGKDVNYCGGQSFERKDCLEEYVATTCPHLCNICPYADPNYKGTTTPNNKGTTTPNNKGTSLVLGSCLPTIITMLLGLIMCYI